MSLKKIHEIIVSPRVQVRTYKDSEWGEFQTRTYRDGKFREAETNFETDRESAIHTAQSIARDLETRANPTKRRNPTKRVNYDKMLPKAQIDFVVGKYHVGTPDEEIAEDIRKRAKKMKWPEGAVTAAVKYAIKRHHANGAVFTGVMSGSFSVPKRRRVS